LSVSSPAQGNNLQYPFNMLDGPPDPVERLWRSEKSLSFPKIEPDCLAVQPVSVIELFSLPMNNQN